MKGLSKFKKVGLLYFLLQVPSVSDAQDSLQEKVTPEVIVEGFSTGKALRKSGASIARLDSQSLERYHNASLRPSMNTVPGVRMDNRGIGGSSRISIRGSQLRAPWGVRNVKAYWNGMPLTKPDGSTPIEVIHPQGLGSMEIIKGPSGSLYGAGNGGVLKFRSKKAARGERSVRAEGMIGRYGMQRQALSAAVGTEDMRVHVHSERIRNEGYRQQEHVNRDFLRLNARFRIDERNSLAIMGYHFDGGWGLPGGLTRSEFSEDPRSAVPFSVSHDASFQHRTTRLGMEHSYRIREGLEHSLTLYVDQGEKENPFGTSPFYHGYKVENAQGWGYRNELTWHKDLGEELSTELILGSEGRSEINTLRNFDNDQGAPGALREHSDTRSRVGLLFLQNHWELPHGFIATLGLSYDRVRYEHRDLYHRDSVDFSNRFSFSPGWVPRISLVKTFQKDLSLRASVSEGFSAPTVWELIRPDGSIDTDLNAERGRNYELGFRGSLLEDRIRFDVVGYWFRLRRAILQEERIGNQAVYANKGRTEQKGVEATLDLRILERKDAFLQKLHLKQSYAYQNYVFGNYAKEGVNLKGNRIPGVADHTWTQVLSLGTRPGFYGELTGRYVGNTPLNDRNSDAFGPYYVMDGRLGFRHSLGKSFDLHLYGGMQNMTGTPYSAFFQINDLNGAYYNPAPVRQWFGGLALSVRL